MKDPIIIEGRTLISSRRAAEITKYSNDYIGQLCRSGKVDARMIGRSWYVFEDSLLSHKEKAEILSRERGYKQLGREFVMNAISDSELPPLKNVIPAIPAISAVSVIPATSAIPSPIQTSIPSPIQYRRSKATVATIIVFLLISLVGLNFAVIEGFKGNTTIAQIGSLESNIAHTGISATVSATASVSDSFASAWGVLRDTVLNSSRKFFAMFDGTMEYSANAPTTPSSNTSNNVFDKSSVKYSASRRAVVVTSSKSVAVADKTTAIPGTTTSTTIVKNIYEQPRTTIVKELDSTVLARISSLEQAIIQSKNHNSSQTDAIYDSVGRSMNNVSSSLSSSIASLSSSMSSSIEQIKSDIASNIASTGNWATDATNAWRVSGNVGIGTSSPYAKLSVVGDIVAREFQN